MSTEPEPVVDARAETPPADGGPLLRLLLGYVKRMDRVSDVLGAISMYIIPPLVAIGFINVVLRYLGRFVGRNLTANFWIETQWYLYSISFLLAFAYILKEQVNVRVDFFWGKWSIRRRATIELIGHLVGLAPFAFVGMWVTWSYVVTSWGWKRGVGFTTWQVWRIWENSPDPSGLPRAPIKTMLLLGFVFLLLQTIAEIFKFVAVLRGREDLVRIWKIDEAEHIASLGLE